MRVQLILPLAACALWGQEAATEPRFNLGVGTRVPLSLINTISTKNASEGDRVYLETVFPVMGDGRIVIPPGSYVAGTVTQVKRPGRVKGRGELYVRFDSLTLPNGVTRDFRGRIGALDGSSNDKLDRSEGKVTSESDKGGDAKKVGEAAVTGTTIGAIAGAAGGNAGKGIGIGAAAGATAGLVGVLLARGPDAILAKGSTLEMVLDRELTFTESELAFAPAARRPPTAAPPPASAAGDPGFPLPGRRD
jgi:type IV secretion system protein VirB10